MIMHSYNIAIAASLSLLSSTDAFAPVPVLYADVISFNSASPPSRSRSCSNRSCGSPPLVHYNRQSSISIVPASATSSDDDDANTPEEVIVTGVTLKMAFDSSPAWGVADLSETKSERFTSPASLDMVHRLRRDSSAVLVGKGTVQFDDCSLSVRRVELRDGQDQPTRVVMDPSLSLIGGDYTILKDGLPTIIYHLQSIEKKDTSLDESVTLVRMNPMDYENDNLDISPAEVIEDLKSRGLYHIMVEGGPATARAFLEAGVVDRAIIVKAPVEFQEPVPAKMDENSLKDVGLNKIDTAMMDGDSIEYWTREGLPWPRSNDVPMWP